MQLAIATVLFLALVSGTAAQCTGNDHPNCASWKTNGYCTNTATPLEQRKLYCGVTCGLCNNDGTQTAAGGGSVVPPCTDANPNCATWQTQTPPFCANPSYSVAMKKQYCCGTCTAAAAVEPPCVDANANCASWQTQTPPFCANPNYTDDMKKMYCCATCSAPAPPATACAAIYTGTATTPIIDSAPTITPPVVLTNTADPVTKVVVKTGCTLELSSDLDNMAINPVGGSPILGDGTFKAITPPVEVVSFSCTCPP